MFIWLSRYSVWRLCLRSLDCTERILAVLTLAGVSRRNPTGIGNLVMGALKRSFGVFAVTTESGWVYR